MSGRRARNAGVLLAALTAAVGVLFLTGGPAQLEQLLEESQRQASSAEPPAGVAEEGTYHRAELGDLDELLGDVDLVDERPDVPGYDRECGPRAGCSFGPAWSDATDAPLSRNGCGTRDDVLTRDLTAVSYRPGTNACVVVAGTLRDPYTGQTIEFRKEAAHEVGIDHIYPLARAWDMGADTWPIERRARFANDPLNLVAVSGRANSSKGDRGPGEWLPVDAGYRCGYAVRFLEVATTYELPITGEDHDALALLAEQCR